MKPLLPLIEKCAVTVKLTSDGFHVSGRGLLGVLAAVVIVFGIAHYAPQLISFVGLR